MATWKPKRLATLMAVLAALVLVPSDAPRAAARQPSAAPVEAFFPVGVWYSGGKARAPMLERLDAGSEQRWSKDLDAIKGVGFNTVKTWVDWATAEPRPGEFHFENLDLLLKLAEQRGLRVVVQLYLDSAPDWVGERFPDARFVDRSGAVIESQAAPGFCIDHPGVRSAIVKFLGEVSRRANRFTALYAWDVWSEPHVINWAEFPFLTNPEFCFCPNSQRRFREWLQQKYGTLDALNAAWYRHFETWQQVAPPRSSTILSYTDYLDWRAFIDDKLQGDLKTRVDAIRSADPQHFITSHAAVPAMFTSPTDGYGDPDDWKMAAVADFYGTSIYPRHSQSTRPWPWQQLAAALDFERSVGRSFGKGFWIGELQAGQGVTGMRIADPVRGDDLRYWMWKVVAHGARQIAIYAWYPMSSGFESNGYGLINLDGTLTERAQAAGEVAKLMQREGASLLSARPAPAPVAVLFNRLSYMVGGAQPSLSRLGNATRDSLLGLHRAFLEEQIPLDFVHPQDATGDRLGQYKILFLPYPVMLSRPVAEAITRYVHNGGTVVAEARLAWNDERGFSSDVVPGFNLAEVFGVREKEIRNAERPLMKTEAAPELPGIAAGSEVPAEAFEEELEPAPGTRVLARWPNGGAAATAHDYGKGRAILVGSFAAVSYQRHPEQAATRQFLVALARAAGVTRDVEVAGEGSKDVEVRRLFGPNEQFVFAFNHSDKPADADIALQPNAARAFDLMSGRAVPLRQTGRSTFLNKQLAPGEVWVVKLE